jgi:hypothetical protein
MDEWYWSIRQETGFRDVGDDQGQGSDLHHLSIYRKLGFHTYLTETGMVVRKLRRDSVRRMKRKIRHFKREFARGEMLCGEHVRQCLASWSGHAEHGDTYNLRRKLFGKLILRRSGE